LAEWTVLAMATVLAFIPTLGTGMTAVILFVAVFLWQRRRATRLVPVSQHT
jgi:hypothetical protein